MPSGSLWLALLGFLALIDYRSLSRFIVLAKSSMSTRALVCWPYAAVTFTPAAVVYRSSFGVLEPTHKPELRSARALVVPSSRALRVLVKRGVKAGNAGGRFGTFRGQHPSACSVSLLLLGRGMCWRSRGASSPAQANQLAASSKAIAGETDSSPGTASERFEADG